MKILYIAYASSPYGGSEEAVGWNLPLAMSQNIDNDVHLITKIEQKEAIEDYSSKHPELRLHVYYCDIPSFYKKVYKGYLYPGRHGIWLKRVAPIVHDLDGRYHFDVIHQIAPVEFRSLIELGKTDAVKVSGPQGGAEYAPKPLKKYLRPAALFEMIRRCSNWLIIHKPSFRKAYRSFDMHLFANKESRQYFIDHGIDASNDIVKTEVGCWPEAWREHQRTDHEVPHILYVGRYIPRKGVELLLDACAVLKEQGFTKYELRMCGWGHLKQKLRDEVAQRDLMNNVTVLGKIPYTEMAEQYAWADFFVMPSVREATGVVLAEAMQNGLGVVTFNQAGATIALNDKVCNYVKTRDGAKGFAQAMREWSEHPEMRPDMQNIKACFESLTWSRRAEYYMRLYEKLINGKHEEKA